MNVDSLDGLQEVTPDDRLCPYIVIDSRDQLLLNVTPHAIDIVTEILQVSEPKVHWLRLYYDLDWSILEFFCLTHLLSSWLSVI